MKTYQHELKAEYFEQDIIMQKELKRIKNEEWKPLQTLKRFLETNIKVIATL